MNILWRWNANDDKGLYSLQIRPSVYGASSLKERGDGYLFHE